MKKKKWIWLILGVIIILGGIGGKVYMDKEKEAKQDKLAETAKKNISIYVVQNFDDAQTIEFNNFKFNEQTGTWHVAAKINYSNLITFSLESLNDISEETIGVRYNPNSFKLDKKQDNSKNLHDIKILTEDSYGN